MKNHTHKAQNMNLGLSETPTKAAQTNEESLWDFESKVSQALLGGLKEVETSQSVIDYFLKSDVNKEAFKQAGNFIYKNVYVTLKK